MSIILVVAVPPGQTGANNFLGSDIGKLLSLLCGAIAVVIVVVCILRMIRYVTGQRPAEGFKVLMFGLIIGGLLFNLQLTVKGTSYMSGVASKVFTSLSKIGNSDSAE
jgi:hypothetical protein